MRANFEPQRRQVNCEARDYPLGDKVTKGFNVSDNQTTSPQCSHIPTLQKLLVLRAFVPLWLKKISTSLTYFSRVLSTFIEPQRRGDTEGFKAMGIQSDSFETSSISTHLKHTFPLCLGAFVVKRAYI